MTADTPNPEAWLSFQKRLQKHFETEHQERVNTINRDYKRLLVLIALLVVSPLIVFAGWSLIGVWP